jgi:hypothetical protein
MKAVIGLLVLCAGSIHAQTVPTVPASSQSAQNQRTFRRTCSQVWPSAVQVMVENDFRPIVLDKSSGVATFAFDVIEYQSTAVRYVKLHDEGRKVRIQAPALLLSDQVGKCVVKARFVFEEWNPILELWLTRESSFAFETTLLDAMGVDMAKQ